MIQAVQFMAGISFLIWGLSTLFRTSDWIALMQSAEQHGRRASLLVGSIALSFGSFIVAFHPVWNGVAMILTIIGWLSVLEGIVYLLFPTVLPFVYRLCMKCPVSVIRISGVILIIVALLLLNIRM